MQIIVHVNGFNEWVPVPADVDTNTASFKKGLATGIVKATMNGGFSMKCPKVLDTHVEVHAQEDDIVQCAIQEMTRGDRQYLNRMQCVARLLSRHVLPHQCHTSHIEEFEIAGDDGPDVAIFDKLISEHIECGNLAEADREPMLAAYTEEASYEDHQDLLHTHFRVNPKKLAAHREARESREDDARTVLAHFHAQRAAALVSKEGVSK